MKLLFTKSLDPQKVAEKLGTTVAMDFVEAIQTKVIKTKAFDLKNHSLIFTSASGVRAFFENGFVPKEILAEKKFNKIYAVGSQTKKALRKHNFGTFKLCKNASELSKFITENSVCEKFLHFCGDLALDVLDEKLPLQNVSYKRIQVYRTELLYPKICEKYQAVVFFSPSGVRSFAKFNSFEDLKIFSIGSTTTSELEKLTENKIITSQENTLADLLDLISKANSTAGETDLKD
ncbi:uroporphyrinogen-III synthase [Chryseobacterium sp. SC28]|uniref:uroporphyrinogen-III synthase n=1 Tax=Chryseobacterium sp. SC28 TaxID=2268028 RepID=UPI000F648D57|nr:uroporphyrinogen-III synthase [Chryseobacterium sp. SC28]RRQ47329.1 uroporphyrinogen-III synthase [Chryseobacterium sp. SC28]